MLQLIYMSTARDVDGDLTEICEQGATNNVKNEITGVLLGENGHFLQVLEGPKATVEDTFLRVIGDKRHHSLLILSRKMLTRREFGDCAMAQCTPSMQREVIELVRGRVVGSSRDIRHAFDVRFPLSDETHLQRHAQNLQPSAQS